MLLRTLRTPFAGPAIRNLSVASQLEKLGLTLPAVNPPKGSYRLTSKAGNLLFLAGHLPATSDGALICGKVGKDLTVEEAHAAAERVGLSILATLKGESVQLVCIA